MDKVIFLEKYSAIESKIFDKSIKNKKIEELVIDVLNSSNSFNLYDIIEIVNFLLNNKIIIRQPIFKEIIYPILSIHIEENNIFAIKTLLKLDNLLVNYQAYTNDKKYTYWQLLEKGLKISSEDKELLKLYENRLSQYLNYTLHELPIGVLFDNNSASIEQCDELLNELNNYKKTTQKLEINNDVLITKCEFHYNSYKAYLKVYNEYNGYEDYLNNKK